MEWFSSLWKNFRSQQYRVETILAGSHFKVNVQKSCQSQSLSIGNECYGGEPNISFFRYKWSAKNTATVWGLFLVLNSWLQKIYTLLYILNMLKHNVLGGIVLFFKHVNNCICYMRSRVTYTWRMSLFNATEMYARSAKWFFKNC